MVTNGSRTPRSSRRVMTFVVALALNLALVANAFAAELVNGEFGTASAYRSFCNTDGWQTTGSVGASTEDAYGLRSGSYDCVAQVQVASGPAAASSTLSQSATATNTTVVMEVLAESSMASEGSQTITLYDASGTVIYSKSRNETSGSFKFCYYMGTAYLGDAIKIEVKTSLGKSYLNSRSSTLYVDNVHFNAGCPWPLSGTGW